MGSGLSTTSRRAVKLTNDKCYRTDSNRNNHNFKLDPVMLSHDQVNEILEDESQKAGTYILYEDYERKKTYLAFKTTDGKVSHHPIVKLNDLYYFNEFPFPYLESIVLYYKKYKFKDTKFTNQAFLDPYLRKKAAKSLSSSVDVLHDDVIESNDKTWTYGHYKSLSTRL